MKNNNTLLVVVILIFIVFVSLPLYLYNYKSINNSAVIKKKLFVRLTQMPDLALVQAKSIRDRSFNTTASVYFIDGNLREISKATFIYNHGNIRNINAR